MLLKKNDVQRQQHSSAVRNSNFVLHMIFEEKKTITNIEMEKKNKTFLYYEICDDDDDDDENKEKRSNQIESIALQMGKPHLHK